MWRRLLTSQFKSVATFPCRSASKTAPLSFKSHISPSPHASLLARHFSAASADTSVKKRVEDIVPIATGHEREELEVEIQGKKILEDVNFPEGPFGTKCLDTTKMSPYLCRHDPTRIRVRDTHRILQVALGSFKSPNIV